MGPRAPLTTMRDWTTWKPNWPLGDRADPSADSDKAGFRRSEVHHPLPAVPRSGLGFPLELHLGSHPREPRPARRVGMDMDMDRDGTLGGARREGVMRSYPTPSWRRRFVAAAGEAADSSGAAYHDIPHVGDEFSTATRGT